jgi:hypothetical protein
MKINLYQITMLISNKCNMPLEHTFLPWKKYTKTSLDVFVKGDGDGKKLLSLTWGV